MPYKKRETKDFFNFTRGEFAIKCSPDHPEAQKRVYIEYKNSGDTVGVERTIHEIRYAELTGRITDIQRVKQKMKTGLVPFWKFHFDDMEKQFVVSLPYSSGWAKQILLRLPNIDPKRFITLVGCLFSDGKTAIMVKQEGNPNVNEETGNINRHWIPKESQELPPMIPPPEDEFGKGQWDDSAQLKFLWNWIEVNFLPNVQAVTVPEPTPKQEIEDAVVESDVVPESDPLEESDDLPF